MNTISFKKIITPVDFSETALRAVDHAAQLAKKMEAELTLVHVLEPYSTTEGRMAYPTSYLTLIGDEFAYKTQRNAELEERLEQHIKLSLESLEKKLKRDGVKVTESIIETGKIHKKINSIAKKLKADLIVMGTHGASGVKEFMAGSNTGKVVRESVCPVLSIREQFVTSGFKTILLPFIDKPHMREHVDYAIKLAKVYGATLDILGIDNEKDTEHFKKVRLEAEQINKLATKSGVKANHDVFPASYMNEFIMNYGKEKKADLIVIMADMNKLGLMQYFTGPVVQQIVNHSPIPVLSIPPTYNPHAVSNQSFHSASEPLF
jgi:nucleotide-binding universal stress UspA family protein